MIAAFSQIQDPAKRGVAFGVLVDLRHVDVLDEVSGIVLTLVRSNAEQNRKLVFPSGKVVERDAYVKSQMETQVKAELGFNGVHGARKVLADVRRLQDRHVRVVDVNGPARPRQGRLGLQQPRRHQ